MDQQLNWEGGFLYQFLTIPCISFLAKVPFPNMITYELCLTLCLIGWTLRIWGLRGSFKGRGYMYTCGWFMLRFDRKQQNSIKQLSFNKKKKIKKSFTLTESPLQPNRTSWGDSWYQGCVFSSWAAWVNYNSAKRALGLEWTWLYMWPWVSVLPFQASALCIRSLLFLSPR